MIRKGVYGSLAIFIVWGILLITQMWFPIFSFSVFIKLSITLIILFIIVLGATLVIDQYKAEKKLKDNDFLDG